MSTELTALNFITKIKSMNKRERKKIRAEELIQIILQVPDDVVTANNAITEDKFSMLISAIDSIKSQSISNALKIETIQEKNVKLTEDNLSLIKHNESIQKELTELSSHVDGIEQYLRINNIEVVGLPEPDEERCEERLIINALNTLPDIEPIIAEDIDICHVIPTKRRDGRRVVICKFISRKKKIAVLNAKKSIRNFKFENNDIFINEHLSHKNRRLFAIAMDKKRQLNYKFLWTKTGCIYMRKAERSSIFTISNDETLNNLI